jgi:hypothetical protein
MSMWYEYEILIPWVDVKYGQAPFIVFRHMGIVLN